MANNNHKMIFLSAPRTFLCLVLSLVALLSMNASAAYANCLPQSETGAAADCFSVQLQTQNIGLINDTSNLDAALISTTNTATTQASPRAANSGFYVNQPHSRDEQLPDSLPLMLLITALLAVFLMRAKNLNNK